MALSLKLIACQHIILTVTTLRHDLATPWLQRAQILSDRFQAMRESYALSQPWLRETEEDYVVAPRH